MFARCFSIGVLAGALAVLAAGCNKDSTPPAVPSGATNSTPKTEAQKPLTPALRLHWLGKKHLSADTNASYFVTIWNLPESARLQAQTLDKLALWLAGATNTSAADPAPAPVPGTNAANTASIGGPTNLDLLVANNATASALRPLLEDLVDSEIYCELIPGTSGAAEVALAVRLDEPRAAAWQAAQDSLRNAQAVRRLPTGALEVKRAGAWTLLNIAASNSPSPASMTSDFASRIQSHPSGTPFTPGPTNYWLEANFDIQKLADAFCPAAPARTGTNSIMAGLPLPSVWLSVNGEEQSVRTRAELEFPRPLNLDLEPWNIPTNIIHDPLASFTAVRGFRPWLQNLKAWQDLHLASTPDQAYVWSMAGMPVLDFCAVPVSDATNTVDALSEKFLRSVGLWVASTKMGHLIRSTNFYGLEWNGAPFISPQLLAMSKQEPQFVVGSLMPLPATGPAFPSALEEAILGRKSLLYYDWELTAVRADQMVFLTQMLRLFSQRAQLSPLCASLQWMKMVGPKLGNCITILASDESNHLSLIRRSTVGLSSLEQHLLTDWLESPQFPLGLHTLLMPRPHTPWISSPPTQTEGKH